MFKIEFNYAYYIAGSWHVVETRKSSWDTHRNGDHRPGIVSEAGTERRCFVRRRRLLLQLPRTSKNRGNLLASCLQVRHQHHQIDIYIRSLSPKKSCHGDKPVLHVPSCTVIRVANRSWSSTEPAFPARRFASSSSALGRRRRKPFRDRRRIHWSHRWDSNNWRRREVGVVLGGIQRSCWRRRRRSRSTTRLGWFLPQDVLEEPVQDGKPGARRTSRRRRRHSLSRLGEEGEGEAGWCGGRRWRSCRPAADRPFNRHQRHKTDEEEK